MIEYLKILKDYVAVIEVPKDTIVSEEKQILIDIIEDYRNELLAYLDKLGVLHEHIDRFKSHVKNSKK